MGDSFQYTDREHTREAVDLLISPQAVSRLIHVRVETQMRLTVQRWILVLLKRHLTVGVL